MLLKFDTVFKKKSVWVNFHCIVFKHFLENFICINCCKYGKRPTSSLHVSMLHWGKVPSRSQSSPNV